MEDPGVVHHIKEGDIDIHGLALIPKESRILYLLAHGAGAGMYHAGMLGIAQAMYEQGIATLRYQFPYKEKGKNAPGSPKEATKTVEVVTNYALTHFSNYALFAGGRSYGGRMTSTAASLGLIQQVKGLVFFGFPLHRPGVPSSERAEHLYAVNQPMLFLQGSKDALANLDYLNPVVEKTKSTLKVMEGADHSFNVLKSHPITKSEVMEELVATAKTWMESQA